MRIVDHKTFLSLPAGTVFSKYSPGAFDSLAIKGETVGTIDFFVQEIDSAVDAEDSSDLYEKLEAAQATGTSLTMDFSCEARDGMFEPDQLFAVWEKADVEGLIARLQQCLPVLT